MTNICLRIKATKEACLLKCFVYAFRNHTHMLVYSCKSLQHLIRSTQITIQLLVTAQRECFLWAQKNFCLHSAALTRNIIHCFSVWKRQSWENDTPPPIPVFFPPLHWPLTLNSTENRNIYCVPLSHCVLMITAVTVCYGVESPPKYTIIIMQDAILQTDLFLSGTFEKFRRSHDFH